MLPLIWIVAPAALLIGGVIIVIFIAVAYWFILLPIVEWMTKPRGGLLRRVATWPFRKAAEKVERFGREHIAALRRYIAANVYPLVLILDQWAEVTQRLAGTLGDMSEQIYEALWTLNHETIPRKINAALVPIRNVLTNHTTRLNDIEDLNRRLAVTVGDALRSLPWGVAGTYIGNFENFFDSYENLWNRVGGQITQRLNDLWNERVPDLERGLNILRTRVDEITDETLDRIRSRIDRLEDVVTNVIPARIGRLEDAVEVLSEQVIGVTGAGLLALLARIEAMETQLATFIGTNVAQLAERVTDLEIALETRLQEIRLDVETRLAALETAVQTTIEQRLTALEIGVATLADQVFQELEADFRVIIEEIAGIKTQIGTIILPRLAAIEAMLEPAALAALVLVALRTAAPNLFCRNTFQATRAICAMDETYIDDLLAMLLFLVGPISIVELARTLGDEMGFFAGSIGAFVMED